MTKTSELIERDGLYFRPVSMTNFTAHVKRGNVVLVEGRSRPQMITQFTYRRGLKVVPFEGPINSRRKQEGENRQALASERRMLNPGERVDAQTVTHVAVRRAR